MPLDMKVGFWNINMGPGSDKNKLAAFTAWCAGQKPDLLCLVEDSFTFDGKGDDLAKMAGMTVLNSVHTLDVNGNTCGKNLVALCSPALAKSMSARVLTFPTLDDAKRALLKVTMPIAGSDSLELWIIHANASAKGGQAAAAAVQSYIDKYPAVVGGDFNCPLGAWPAAYAPFWPLNWAGDKTLFTQWNQLGASAVNTPDYIKSLMLKPGTNFSIAIKPNTVLDYAVCNKARKLTPLPSMSGDDWRNILPMFDHAPVLYQLN